MVISLFEDISHWQVISDGSVFLCGRDFSDRNISPADGPSQKKKRLCTEYIIPAVSQAACLGHILGSSVVTDTSKNSFDKEEIRHWLNRMLNYAAETKQALTGMMSEAPTKHILNVKAIPTSHWEFLLPTNCNGSGLQATGKKTQTKTGERKETKVTVKEKAGHWKGEGEDFHKKRLWGERKREMSWGTCLVEGEGQGAWSPLVTSLANGFPVRELCGI